MTRERWGLIPAAADFDVAAMGLTVNKFDAEEAGKELDIINFDPGNIEIDLKWRPLKDALLNLSTNVMGVDNDPLYYVIRPDHPAGWVPPNAFEKRMYQLPHTGTVYYREKKMLWVNTLKESLNTLSWERIKEFESTGDSRAA